MAPGVPLPLLAFLLVACGGEDAPSTPLDTAPADVDPDTDSDTDTGSEGVAPGLYTLINHEAADEDLTCASTILVLPVAGEEQDWALARLTPPGYPFRVEGVVASFLEDASPPGGTGGACLGGTTHVVRLYASTDPNPSPSPTWAVEATETTLEVQDGVWALEVTPPTPLVLQSGEHLFVAIQQAGTFPNVGCMAACGGSTSTGRNFWAEGASAPHTWSEVSSVDFLVAVPGEVTE